MKRIMLAAALVAAATGAHAQDVAGQWKTPTRNAVIAIAHCGSSLCGTLVSSDGLRANPDLRDGKNKDTALRTRRLAGLAMLWGFVGGDGKWINGHVYNPDDGGTYNGTLTLADANHLDVRGCIFWPLCKTQTWTRLP